jgi:hypothetical protein
MDEGLTDREKHEKTDKTMVFILFFFFNFFCERANGGHEGF